MILWSGGYDSTCLLFERRTTDFCYVGTGGPGLQAIRSIIAETGIPEPKRIDLLGEQTRLRQIGKKLLELGYPRHAITAGHRFRILPVLIAVAQREEVDLEAAFLSTDRVGRFITSEVLFWASMQGLRLPYIHKTKVDLPPPPDNIIPLTWSCIKRRTGYNQPCGTCKGCNERSTLQHRTPNGR